MSIYSRYWRCRDGSTSKVEGFASQEECDDAARSFGWPGHTGTRWEYFKDDLRRWFDKTMNAVGLF